MLMRHSAGLPLPPGVLKWLLHCFIIASDIETAEEWAHAWGIRSGGHAETGVLLPDVHQVGIHTPG